MTTIKDHPPLTVGALRKALATVPARFDDLKVEVWLPGSTIRLETQGDERSTFLQFRAHPGKMLLEGNVNPGSALDDVANGDILGIDRPTLDV